MKKLEAIIKPTKLDAVRDALRAVGIEAMTLSETKGFGGPSAAREGSVPLRGAPYLLEYVPRLKLELFLHDEQVEPALEAISEAAYTGRVGDGIIAVLPVEDVLHIRSKNRGPAAL